MNRLRLLVLVALIMLPGCAGPYTVAVIVRHAEKQAGSDPQLTAAGQQRANELRDRLAGVNITGVYSTDTQRTRQTANPTAQLFGVPVTTYQTPDLVAAQTLNSHHGEAVLIVGHSNTVADIVVAFGANLPVALPQPINDNDYDNMVTVIIDSHGVASAVHQNYGAISP